MAALIAKTLVGEKRRTWRGIIQSVIMRNFNSQAVERRKEDPRNKKDFNGRRVTGSYRIEYFLDWLVDFMDKVSVAKEELGPERIAALVNGIEDVAEKAGCEEVDKLVADIEEAIKKPMAERAAEKASGYKATTTMDGTLKLSDIKKCNGDEPGLDEEIVVCKIPNNLKEWNETIGWVDEADLADTLRGIGFREKIKFLKCHEARRSQEENIFKTFEDALKETNAIEPFGETLAKKLADRIDMDP